MALRTTLQLTLLVLAGCVYQDSNASRTSTNRRSSAKRVGPVTIPGRSRKRPRIETVDRIPEGAVVGWPYESSPPAGYADVGPPGSWSDAGNPLVRMNDCRIPPLAVVGIQGSAGGTEPLLFIQRLDDPNDPDDDWAVPAGIVIGYDSSLFPGIANYQVYEGFIRRWIIRQPYLAIPIEKRRPKGGKGGKGGKGRRRAHARN